MKKLLILTLVLAMASMASATVTYEFRDSTATSAISSAPAGGSYTLVMNGLVTDQKYEMGVYDGAGASAGKFEFTGVTILAAAGDGGKATHWGSPYDGYDCTAEDLFGDVPPNSADGDWMIFAFDVDSGATGTLVVDLTSLVSPYPVLDTAEILIPEPMTIALLGLGGLFLRRRK